MLEFNINDLVKVQLTQKGIKHMREYYDSQLRGILSHTKPDYQEERREEMTDFFAKEQKIPADGWKEFQLWQLMQIFGPTMPWFTTETQCFVENTLRIVDRAEAIAA